MPEELKSQEITMKDIEVVIQDLGIKLRYEKKKELIDQINGVLILLNESVEKGEPNVKAYETGLKILSRGTPGEMEIKEGEIPLMEHPAQTERKIKPGGKIEVGKYGKPTGPKRDQNVGGRMPSRPKEGPDPEGYFGKN